MGGNARGNPNPTALRTRGGGRRAGANTVSAVGRLRRPRASLNDMLAAARRNNARRRPRPGAR